MKLSHSTAKLSHYNQEAGHYDKFNEENSKIIKQNYRIYTQKTSGKDRIKRLTVQEFNIAVGGAKR